MRSTSSSQRECVLTVANEVRLSTRRGKAEAKELPFSFFFGRGRGFYLRSVAPSSPKPSLTPLHVICGDMALLTQSVADLNLRFQGIGLGDSNL